VSDTSTILKRCFPPPHHAALDQRDGNREDKALPCLCSRYSSHLTRLDQKGQGLLIDHPCPSRWSIQSTKGFRLVVGRQALHEHTHVGCTKELLEWIPELHPRRDQRPVRQEMKEFLDLQIVRDRPNHHLDIRQQKYTQKIINEFLKPSPHATKTEIPHKTNCV
jgi:hypothetical protein